MVAARQGRVSGGLEPQHEAGGVFAGHPAGMVVVTSTLVGAVACGVSFTLGRNPFTCEGWMGARGPASWLLSLGLGLLVGTLTIAVTPIFVQRWHWASALHSALQPTVRGSGDGALFAVAVASAAGEELFFRGLLVPLAGVVASSVLFGALHQIRGYARWGWMVWACVMGLLFAAIFAATGSLAGPLVAHAAINHHNLRFLRDHNPSTRTRTLGGLLRRG
jgi:membrane protease YdiL (CAAX protease family)